MDYKTMLTSTYEKCLAILKNKYGPVSGNYYLDEGLERKNPNISRTREGLIIHHDQENEFPLLSGLMRFFPPDPFEVQKSEYLTYCNYIEHLILHLLIYIETNGKHSKQGILVIVQDINHMFENIEGEYFWKRNCFNIIKGDFDFYITLLNDYIIPLYKNSPNELSIIDGSMDSNKVHMSLLQYQNKKSQE